jgi:hypothetical protein
VWCGVMCARRPADGECQDGNAECGVWSKMGECATNPGYMKVHCRLSCEICDPHEASVTTSHKEL